jgi:hypothetical protein
MAYYSSFVFEFGKYAGLPLYDVPLNYLRWAVKNMDSLSAGERSAIRLEIARQESRRDDQGYRSTPPQRPSAPPVAVDTAIGLEIIKEGRRALALKYHPDRGGDPERMTRANATADYLEKRLPLLLGASA